jgi:hypothetical protein
VLVVVAVVVVVVVVVAAETGSYCTTSPSPRSREISEKGDVGTN